MARFLLRLGIASADVEDLVQEVFVVAHRHGGYVPGPAKPSSWLARIAVGLVAGYRRKKRNRPELLDDVAVGFAVSSVATPAERAETMQALVRVQHALDKLEMERRVVLVLFEFEGESCDQIAAALDVPIGTVYSRLHTARKEFEAAYRRVADAPARRTGGEA